MAKVSGEHARVGKARTTLITPASTATRTPSAIPTSTVSWSATVSAIHHQADVDFEQLVGRVKAQDPDLDFTELRIAFAWTSQYDPYGLQYRQLREEMVSALDAGEFEHALELAEKFMTINYVFPEAHVVAIHAYDALGKSEDANFHRYVLNGLIESILSSGDGKTPQSAYKIVLIEEEYLILEVKGIKEAIGRESFVEGCDAFDGVDSKTGQAITVYFDPSIPVDSFIYSLPGSRPGHTWSSGC